MDEHAARATIVPFVRVAFWPRILELRDERRATRRASARTRRDAPVGAARTRC